MFVHGAFCTHCSKFVGSSCVPLTSAYQVMDCSACGCKANFRARSDGEPFQWWCHDCYKFCFQEHERVLHDIENPVIHDIENPVICCKCHVLPATCRVHTTLLWQDGSKTTYWCFGCYERDEHHEPHHVCDLDSASDSPSEEDVGAAEEVEEDVGAAEEHVLVQQEDVGAAEEVGAQIQDGAMSESSWQIQDGAMSENSWQIPDDCSSTKSFNLTWHQVDPDDDASDASSQCSFMMLTPGSLTAEDLHKHQQCDAAADAAATEDAVSTSNNLGAGQEQHAPAEQEHQQRGQMHTILALHDPTSSSKQSTAAASQESQPTSSSSSSPAAAALSFGKWQEQQELDIALALSMEQQVVSQLASDSSSCSSSAATAAAVLAAAHQKKTKGLRNRDGKKVPRWPLSDFQTKPLQPIPEQPILSIPYQTPSGCLETMFINQEDDDAVAHLPCTKHGLDHHPHCRYCVNYQFMFEKSQYAMAEQKVLELSLDNSKIVGPVGPYMQCSKHGEDFKEDCPTCMKICDLKDQWES